jgi:hypothetical protein
MNETESKVVRTLIIAIAGVIVSGVLILSIRHMIVGRIAIQNGYEQVQLAGTEGVMWQKSK